MWVVRRDLYRRLSAMTAVHRQRRVGVGTEQPLVQFMLNSEKRFAKENARKKSAKRYRKARIQSGQSLAALSQMCLY